MCLKYTNKKHLVLNWEKCYFMVREGIVLGHLVSERGIEIDRAKIEVIEQLPPREILEGSAVSLVMLVFITAL